jgi:hypothetical protein
MDPVEEFLAHHGVKGMKWGVNREARLGRLTRVGAGTATRGQKVHTVLTDIGKNEIKRSGGLKEAAAKKAGTLEERKARIQSGKATTKDFIALHGGDRVSASPTQAKIGKVVIKSAKSVSNKAKLTPEHREAGKAFTKKVLKKTGDKVLEKGTEQLATHLIKKVTGSK